MKTLSQNISSITNQAVVVRANFDVPIENGQVQDTTRIEDAISTINFLLQNGNTITLLAHYDRPEGKPDEAKSLKPVATTLSELIKKPVDFIDYQQDYRQLKATGSPITLLENLRFYPEEEANNPDFAAHLATLGQTYINEAFANCHRDHASITGITTHLPSFAGLSLEKEITTLMGVRENPKKPLIVVIGGAKLETKEPLIEVFASKADHILVGGKSAVDLHDKQGLPQNVIIANLTEDNKDITEESANQFAEMISNAATVIWNGTMGIFEESEHQTGTRIVATAVNTTPAFTIIGGGDTETALTELDLQSGIDHVSTGGGAMLELLSKGELIGIKPLL